MTDYTHDTPSQARDWCPGCAPERDPSIEILEYRPCHLHAPAQAGADDAALTPGVYMSGSADAGGDGNRAICDLIHRPAARCRDCGSELTPDDNRSVCEVCGWASAG